MLRYTGVFTRNLTRSSVIKFRRLNDHRCFSSSTGEDKSSSDGSNGQKEQKTDMPYKKVNTQTTYYEVLGVSVSATKEEIKKAYLKKAKELHPDANQDDPLASVKFQAVQEAYSVLGNTWKRNLYDTDLRFAKEGPAAAAKPPSSMSPEEEAEWRKRFGAETEEQRAARRERYRRYAAGEREDIPEDHFGWMVPLIVVGTLAAMYYSLREAPKHWGSSALIEDFNDRDTSDEMRGVRSVRAFHNPITDKWERLPEGYTSPTPFALFKFYDSRPDLLPMRRVVVNGRAKRMQQNVDPEILPVNGLTILGAVPETQTTPPLLLLDEKTSDLMVWDKMEKKAITIKEFDAQRAATQKVVANTVN